MCVVNRNMYCDGVPEWEEEPIQSSTGFYGRGTCKLTPETCGRCIGSKELYDRVPQELRDKVSKASFKETVVLKEKPKTAGKKKVVEHKQGSLF